MTTPEIVSSYLENSMHEVSVMVDEFPVGTEVFVEPLWYDIDRKCLVRADVQRARAVVTSVDPSDWYLPFCVTLREPWTDEEGNEINEGEDAWVSRVSHINPLEVPTFTSREEADAWLATLADRMDPTT